MPLSDRAILSHLSISCWTGSVALDVNKFQELDIKRDSVKRMVVPFELLAPLYKSARQLRSMHHTFSAPWDDNGLRLVPSTHLMDYTQRLQTLRLRYEEKVAAAIPELRANILPDFVNRIGNLESKFGVRVSYYQIPDGSMPLLTDTVEKSVRDTIASAMQDDAAQRLKEIEERLLLEAKKSVEKRIAKEPGGTANHLLWDMLKSLLPTEYVHWEASPFLTNQEMLAEINKKLGVNRGK